MRECRSYLTAGFDLKRNFRISERVSGRAILGCMTNLYFLIKPLVTCDVLLLIPTFLTVKQILHRLLLGRRALLGKHLPPSSSSRIVGFITRVLYWIKLHCFRLAKYCYVFYASVRKWKSSSFRMSWCLSSDCRL